MDAGVYEGPRLVVDQGWWCHANLSQHTALPRVATLPLVLAPSFPRYLVCTHCYKRRVPCHVYCGDSSGAGISHTRNCGPTSRDTTHNTLCDLSHCWVPRLSAGDTRHPVQQLRFVDLRPPRVPWCRAAHIPWRPGRVAVRIILNYIMALIFYGTSQNQDLSCVFAIGS